MKVPLLDLSFQHQPHRQDMLKAIERVLDSQHFILGPEVEKLEAAIAAYTKTHYAVGVSSGTDALLVALLALGIGAGDEVITTPYTFFATAGVIARVGAVPVFADIDPVTYTIDPAKVERAVTARTKAIMPVHLFGQCADMAPLLATAQIHGIPVIEDAAQAIGTNYKDGRRAGGIGRVGCFSFFPTKNLGALGDGGIVTTNDTALAEKIRVLRVHGSKPKYHHHWIGGNFRLDALQAAVLSVKLPALYGWTQQRQENAARYDTLFKEAGLIGADRVRLPTAVYPTTPHSHIYNQYVIRVPRRDALLEHLKQQQVGTEVYYPIPLHLQECFQSLGHKPGDFPESERAAQETLALPIYPGLTADQQAWVVNAIKKGLNL